MKRSKIVTIFLLVCLCVSLVSYVGLRVKGVRYENELTNLDALISLQQKGEQSFNFTRSLSHAVVFLRLYLDDLPMEKRIETLNTVEKQLKAHIEVIDSNNNVVLKKELDDISLQEAFTLNRAEPARTIAAITIGYFDPQPYQKQPYIVKLETNNPVKLNSIESRVVVGTSGGAKEDLIAIDLGVLLSKFVAILSLIVLGIIAIIRLASSTRKKPNS